MFEPIVKTNICDQIVDKIFDLIKTKRLNPGDKLPSERELMEILNASRAPIREALRVLESLGIVEIKHGQGTYIKELHAPSVIEPLVYNILLERSTMKELVEVRRLIEVGSAELAAIRATEEDLLLLEKNIQQMEEDLKAGKGYRETDLLFHITLAESTRNSMIPQLLNYFRGILEQSLKKTEIYPGEMVLDAHREILEALKERDAEKAKIAVHNHLNVVERILMREEERQSQSD